MDCYTYVFLNMNTCKKKEKIMEFRIKDTEEFIKLGQVLKACNLVSSGVEAKEVIQDGQVKVNGEVDERRGRKLYGGDHVEYDGQTIDIIK